MRSTVFKALTLAITLSIAAQADALVQYELNGKAGTEVSNAPTFVDTNLAGLDMSRGSGLTPAAAVDGFGASGWDDGAAADFFSFGFTVQPGFSVTLNELKLSARSSSTGPGFMNVLISINGGSETVLAPLAMPNTLFLDSDINLNNLVISSSAVIFLRAANTTSASGGTVGSAGTFRLSDFSPDGGSTFEPVALLGTVNAVTATPEPATAALSLAALALLGLAYRGRNDRISTRSRFTGATHSTN